MKKKVYVLGAGASRALNDGAPTMWELNQHVFDSIQKGDNQRLKRLQAFTKQFYPDLPPGESILLEEILTLLDANINEDRPLTAGYNVQELRQLREDFIYAIGSVLKNSLGTSKLKNAWEWLEFRNNTILRFLNTLNEEDCIITLNYDLILDNRISECLFHNEIYSKIPIHPQIEFHNDVNYGFQPRCALIESTQREYYPYPFIPLYKLHGSLNWLYCPLCRKVDISLGRKGILPYALDNTSLSICKQCKVKYEPMIITPTLLKSYSNPYISHIWREAETALNLADEIIFIGYSMPDADVILRTVFSRALFVNRTLNKRKPSLTVVDYDSSSDSIVAKNYRRTFGDIDYYWHGFIKYIEERLS